ncbi:MAG TPA: PP2C family protein-serine/threonine phosphatase [Armatimonadaceae bacterium]|nr:PP2C family protein-serine/threonine phosphatase [Armatimonadaceae bacterium]
MSSEVRRLRTAAIFTAIVVFGVVELLVRLVSRSNNAGGPARAVPSGPSLPAGPGAAATLPPAADQMTAGQVFTEHVLPVLIGAVVIALAMWILLRLFEGQEERIDTQQREIETLHAMDTAIASEMELPRVLNVAAQKILVALDAEASGISLFDSATGKLVAEAYAMPDASGEEERQRFLGLVRTGRSNDPDWATAVSKVVWSGEVGAWEGYLVAARRRPGREFVGADAGLLDDLASMVVVAVRNARALAAAREAVIVKKALRREQELRTREEAVSRALTEELLPDIPSRSGPWSFSKRYQAQSDEAPVGGDIYDLFRLGPGRWGVVIADVSGKGLDAARRTAFVKYGLRTLARQHDSPSRVLTGLNDALASETDVPGFVTLVYGVLTDDGRFCYASAGHEPPILRRASGKFESLAPTGSVLGAMEAMEYGEETVRLEPGDGLLLFTDGLTEARAEETRAFLDVPGVKRYLDDVCGIHPPEAVADALLEVVRAYAGEQLSDDTALLWIARSRADVATELDPLAPGPVPERAGAAQAA